MLPSCTLCQPLESGPDRIGHLRAAFPLPTITSWKCPLLCGCLQESSALSYANGLPTSLTQTGQQWDLPNAWAPLQHMVILGEESFQRVWGASLCLRFALHPAFPASAGVILLPCSSRRLSLPAKPCRAVSPCPRPHLTALPALPGLAKSSSPRARELAFSLAQRWLQMNLAVYEKYGGMFEKVRWPSWASASSTQLPCLPLPPPGHSWLLPHSSIPPQHGASSGGPLPRTSMRWSSGQLSLEQPSLLTPFPF